MGLRSILKKKGDGDSDDDQYQPVGQNPFLDDDQQAPSSYHHHHHQQQFQQRGPPPPRPPPAEPLQTPEFTFIRSDTFSQEVIHPPTWNDSGLGSLDEEDDQQQHGSHLQPHDAAATAAAAPLSPRGRSFDVFRRSSRSSQSASSQTREQEKVFEQPQSSQQLEPEKHKENRLSRKLSKRLHLHRSPSSAASSTHVPANLPEIVVPEGEAASVADLVPGISSSSSSTGAATTDPAKESSRAAKKPPPANPIIESQWEKRATLLALENEKQHIHNAVSRPTTPEKGQGHHGKRRGRALSSAPPPISPAAVATASAAAETVRSRSQNGASSTTGAVDVPVSSKELDASIQEAIRLHEAGQLQESTRLFGILADPRGHNNPLSQVLYGLALRHGWGCEPDTEAAVTYLSAAASNAAAVEELALQAGMKKGGAAKGELVLAIFELANCFRHGWGLEKDPIAAKQYYETAANLGDTDAMNEVAWCYLEGFGCKKDKFAASKYYRLAEQNGNKTLGNTWIWKEKYDPERQKPKKK